MKNPKHFSAIYEKNNHQLRVNYAQPQIITIEYVGNNKHYAAVISWVNNAETIKQIILSHVHAINTMNNANFDHVEIGSDLWQKLTGKKPRRSIRK